MPQLFLLSFPRYFQEQLFCNGEKIGTHSIIKNCLLTHFPLSVHSYFVANHLSEMIVMICEYIHDGENVRRTK